MVAGVETFGDDGFLGAVLAAALAADRGVPDLLPTPGDGVDGWEVWLILSSSINFMAISSFFCSSPALSEGSCKLSYANGSNAPIGILNFYMHMEIKFLKLMWGNFKNIPMHV